MCMAGRQGRDRPGTWSDMCTGQEDRGSYGPDAGCMTKVWGDREHEGE